MSEDEGLELVGFEQQVAAEGRAARELYREALRALDGVAAEADDRQRLEERWVATTFGQVRI